MQGSTETGGAAIVNHVMVLFLSYLIFFEIVYCAQFDMKIM